MLTIDVFNPDTVRLTVANKAEIWLNPTGEQSANPVPTMVLASHGQAMAGINQFFDGQSGSVVCNPTLAAAYPQLSCHPIGIGSRLPIQLGEVTGHITMVGSLSDSALPNGHYGGLACGYIVHVAGHTVYLAGPTGVCNELRFIGDFYKPNIAVLAIDEHQGIGLHYLHRVLSWVGADMIIPWPLNPTVDTEAIRETIDAYSTAFCKLLQPGMSWELPEALSSGRSSGPESRY